MVRLFSHWNMEFVVTESIVSGHGHAKLCQNKLFLNPFRIRALVYCIQCYSEITVNNFFDAHRHHEQNDSIICFACVCAHPVLFVFNIVEEENVTNSSGMYHEGFVDETFKVRYLHILWIF